MGQTSVLFKEANVRGRSEATEVDNSSLSNLMW